MKIDILFFDERNAKYMNMYLSQYFKHNRFHMAGILPIRCIQKTINQSINQLISGGQSSCDTRKQCNDSRMPSMSKIKVPHPSWSRLNISKKTVKKINLSSYPNSIGAYFKV